jgi:hypothetical protein
MEALVTRVGEKENPYLVEFYDVNCPFCARAALEVWGDLMSSGAYFELVYLPVHYAIWKDAGSPRTAEGSYLANLSAFCVDDPVQRVKYILELFKITASVRNEPKAIEEQLEYAGGRFGELRSCVREKVGRLADDPELAYELAHEYALSIDAVVTGVPTAGVVDRGRAVEVRDGLGEVEELIKKYLSGRRRAPS